MIIHHALLTILSHLMMGFRENIRKTIKYKAIDKLIVT